MTTKLEQNFNKARTKYMRCLRNRQDVASVVGFRWKETNDILLQAEEEYHFLGDKLKKREAKKLAKKTSKG